MGRRKGKGRCAKKNKNAQGEPQQFVDAPHSFVIHKGLPGGNIEDLTRDFRRVMEPFTASQLKERKKNNIKDFVSIAGLLHVSHLCIFSNTEIGMYLKISRLARGPTLTFKIQNFSLARDVISSLKKQNVVEQSFKHSPLIVLNSFSGEGMEMKLMASTFQNMFPSINLTNVDLNTVRRCVLLNYNPQTKLIEFRHYNIKVTPVGISKGVKKVVQGKVPNLAKCNDIDEFITKAGILSESEFEDDGNTVTLGQKMVSRGNVEQGQSAIRLTELGPRLTLQLMKIEEGLLDGEVLYHDLIYKTEEEKEAIKKSRETKRKIKEKRKRVQEDNTKKKENEKQQHKEKSLKGMQKGQTETDRLMKESSRASNREVPVEDDDDAEYYRKEVGEEPDKDLFRKPQFGGVKRPNKAPFNRNAKKPRRDNEPKEEKIVGKAFRVKSKLAAQQRNRAKTENRDFRPIGGGSAFKKGIRKGPFKKK